MKTYLLSFSLGGLLASSSVAWLFLVLPVALILAALKSKSVFCHVLMVLVGSGWVLINLALVEQSALDTNEKPYRDTVVGSISRVAQKANKTEFDLDTPAGKIKASCYRCPLSFSDGEEWRLALRFKPILNLYNPGGFDYRKWMLAKGYVVTATVDSKSPVNKRLQWQGLTLRGYVSEIIDVKRTPILRALLLGDKAGLKADEQRLINRAGISHLFVVSGLHISLAALLVVMAVAWLQRPFIVRHWRFSHVVSLVLGLTFAALYGYLSGMNTPAIRALIMLVCAFFILWGRRNISALVYWLLALVFVLIVSPLAFTGLGAWLSFGIVLALIVGMSGVEDNSGLSLGDSRMQSFIRSFKRYLRGLFRAQWFAFFAGGVILIVFNVPVTPISFALNICLIPVVSLFVVPLAFIGVATALFGDVTLLLFVEQLLVNFIRQMHELEGAIFSPFMVHDDNRYLVVTSFLLFLLPRSLRAYPLAALILLLALIIKSDKPDVGAFKLMVFDVGQGSSALITTRSHSILIDTGYGKRASLGMADYIVLPYLRKLGLAQLDKVFLTHDDADHAGGVGALKSQYISLTRQGSCQEESWEWDEVVFHQFQSPEYKVGNNGTCLLRVESKSGASVLFAGDIEKKAERSLIKHYPQLLQSDVLLVPHHGSKTSSSSGFLNAVNPSLAIISAGKLNHFGHPHSEVIARYDDRLVKIYSTGSHGAVEVEFSPRQAARIVSTYRPRDQYE